MAKKYYAVANGRAGSGIYLNWPQTEENIRGVSGVRFKAFPTEEQARQFLREQGIGPEAVQLFQEPSAQGPGRTSGQAGVEESWRVPEKGAVHDGGVMEAYVDGSFRQGYDCYGYGVVIVRDQEAVKLLSGTGCRPEYLSMRNVAGEVLGAVRAMQHALESGADEIILYFDYQGIESWATGAWKRNNDLTRGYHEFVKSLSGRLGVRFCKVKGHSGDQFNDLADELAKQAVAGTKQDKEDGGRN